MEKQQRAYNVPEGVRFDGVLSGQRDAAEDDEDEDEVGEVGVMDEVVTGDSQAGNSEEMARKTVQLAAGLRERVREISSLHLKDIFGFQVMA